MQSRLPPWILALALGLGLAGCGTLSSRQLADPTEAVARLRAGGNLQEEVDRLARPLIEQNQVRGMVVGVCLPDGQCRSFGYGTMAGRGPVQLPDGDTIFEIGSITKVFVAAALAILVEEGGASYSDTVRSILPPEVKVSESVGQLTLHDLVTHRSGIPRQPENLRQMHYMAEYVLTGRNPYRFIDRNYLYEFIRTRRVPPKKEREYIYSNLAYGFLGHLLEVKTGRTLPELIEAKICRPLGMTDTGFALTDGQRRRLAQGHAGDQPKLVRRHTPQKDWDMGEIMRGSGGMYSTANDLMIFAKSNLGLSGHRLDPLLAATHEAVFQTPEEDVALGWMNNHYPQWGTSISYMNGVLAGYSSYLGMNTSNRVAVAVLYANFNWEDKVGHNLVLRLSGAAAPAGAAANRAQAQGRGAGAAGPNP